MSDDFLRNGYEHEPSQYEETYDDEFFENAVEIEQEHLSPMIDSLLTLSLICSTVLFPFACANIAIPGIMDRLLQFPQSLLVLAYIIVGIVGGIKISALFGCKTWERIISKKT